MNLLVYIKPVIKYANAILLTIKELAKSLALLKEQVDGIDYTKEFANFGEAIESVTGVVDDLNQSMNELLGFDTLNVLGSSNSLTSGLGVEQRILDELYEYNMILENVKYEAKEISQNILTWLGFTRQLNSETGEYNWILSEGYTNIEKIRDVIIGIISSLLAYGIGTKIAQVVTSLKEVGTALGTSSSGIFGTIGLIATIVGSIVIGFQNVYNKSEDFRNSINGSLENIKNWFIGTGERLKVIWDFLTPALNWIWNMIKEIGAQIVNGILKGLELTLALWDVDFPRMWEITKQHLLDIGNMIGRIFGFENWNSMIEKIKELWASFKNWMNEKIWKPIGNFFINIINGVIKGFELFVNNLISGINGITSALSSVWEFTGIPAIPQIQNVSYNTIPALAKGGVIDKPTTALMGEYANAKSNPEIVTPENLMRQVFLESMLPIAQAISSGNGEVVNAIEDLANRPIELNGRKVSENIYDDLQKVFLRKTGYKVNYGK